MRSPLGKGSGARQSTQVVVRRQSWNVHGTYQLQDPVARTGSVTCPISHGPDVLPETRRRDPATSHRARPRPTSGRVGSVRADCLADTARMTDRHDERSPGTPRSYRSSGRRRAPSGVFEAHALTRRRSWRLCPMPRTSHQPCRSLRATAGLFPPMTGSTARNRSDASRRCCQRVRADVVLCRASSSPRCRSWMARCSSINRSASCRCSLRCRVLIGLYSPLAKPLLDRPPRAVQRGDGR